MVAAARGHLAMVQALLAKGAEVNAKTPGGWTALMKAAEGGHLAVVQALLDKGAEVNAKSPLPDALDVVAIERHDFRSPGPTGEAYQEKRPVSHVLQRTSHGRQDGEEVVPQQRGLACRWALPSSPRMPRMVARTSGDRTGFGWPLASPRPVDRPSAPRASPRLAPPSTRPAQPGPTHSLPPSRSSSPKLRPLERSRSDRSPPP